MSLLKDAVVRLQRTLLKQTNHGSTLVPRDEEDCFPARVMLSTMVSPPPHMQRPEADMLNFDRLASHFPVVATVRPLLRSRPLLFVSHIGTPTDGR